MNILAVPPPQPGGGPSNAVLRVINVLQARGHSITTNLFSSWDCALLNVGVGIRFDLLRLIRLGRRLVYRVDGCYVEEIFKRQGRSWENEYYKTNKRIQKALSTADHIIYQTQFAKNHLDKLFTTTRENFSIIPNGVDLSLFKPRSLREETKIVIGCIGTFRENRIKVLVDICNKLSIEHQLLIVGRMDEQCNHDLQSAQKINSKYCEIKYSPQITNDVQLVEFYQKIDCFIHPIIGDTCSNAVIEALACGVPVIVPQWSGSSSLVGSGGLVVEQPPWEDYNNFISGYVEAIKKILDSQVEFSAQARKRASDKFDIAKIALRYEAALAGENRIT